MSIVKKLLVAVVVVSFILVAALVIAGMMMPGEWKFENETWIDAPADKVWQVITDKQRYTEWQTQLERVEIIDDANWIEYPKSAPEPLRFRLENGSRPTRMEFSSTMGDSIRGHWTGDMRFSTSTVLQRTGTAI